MISVIIPLYNGAKFIQRSINSVLNQTYQNFEIVVVNDGSTDHGPQIVAQWQHSSIKLISQKNSGVSIARNTGIKAAKGNIIAFLDADDEWLPNHLEVIHHLVERYPECGVFGTSYFFKRENESLTLPVLPNKFSFTGTEGILYNYYELASGTDFPMQTSAYAVRKEIIQKIGGFPSGIPSGEDIITLARLQAVCDFAYSKEPTSLYYVTNSENKSIRTIKDHDPLDAMFHELYKQISHKKGSRLFLSSWHNRRMSGALINRKYKIGFREFFKAFCIFPFYKKLYTSFIITFLAGITRTDLYRLNKILKGKQH